MNEVIDRQILLVGLPETGKTSFLAALSHYVKTDIVGKTMEQYKLSANSAYLNTIITKWLNCEKQDRTNTVTVSIREVVLHLKKIPTGEILDLNVPDIAGESFQTQFTDRLITEDYEKQIRNSSGLLLFINPEKCRSHALIDEQTKALEYFLDDTDENEIVGFDLKNSPTQVVLVDLLKTHLEFLDSPRMTVAVVISAWDQILAVGITPMKWIEINLPLFYQFLISNKEDYNFKVFGISAQGGTLSTVENINALRELNEPADKIIVQEEDQQHKHICAPLEWIISQW